MIRTNNYLLLFIGFFMSIIFVSCTSKQEILPYKYPDNSIEERVDDLLSRMTIEEKAGQLIMIIGLERLKQNEKPLKRCT